MHRRHFIAGLAAGCLPLNLAQGQPASTTDELAAGRLTLFAPSPENGGWSGLARAIAGGLSEDGIDSALVHDPAGSVAGLRRFVRDYGGRGDVLMVCGAGMIGAVLMARLSTSLANLTPVARLTTEYLVVAVRPDLPYQSLADLVASLTMAPAGIQFCGGNIGTMDHLLAAMIARRAGIDARQLRYRPYIGGTGAIEAILQGRESCVIAGLSELQPHLALGQLRALAISAPQRLPGIGVPTFLEQGMNIELTNWRGLFAPADLAPGEAERLIALTDRMVAGANWKAMLFRYNWIGDYLAGPAFGSFVRSEIARVRATLSDLGM